MHEQDEGDGEDHDGWREGGEACAENHEGGPTIMAPPS